MSDVELEKTNSPIADQECKTEKDVEDNNKDEDGVEKPMLISLETSDGVIYKITGELCKQMDLLQEDLFADVIPIHTVDSPTFAMVLKWCQTVGDDPVEDVNVGRSILNNILKDSDTDDNMIYKLASAANSLKIPTLLEATSQRLAEELNDMKFADEDGDMA